MAGKFPGHTVFTTCFFISFLLVAFHGKQIFMQIIQLLLYHGDRI